MDDQSCAAEACCARVLCFLGIVLIVIGCSGSCWLMMSCVAISRVILLSWHYSNFVSVAVMLLSVTVDDE